MATGCKERNSMQMRYYSLDAAVCEAKQAECVKEFRALYKHMSGCAENAIPSYNKKLHKQLLALRYEAATQQRAQTQRQASTQASTQTAPPPPVLSIGEQLSALADAVYRERNRHVR